MKEILITIGAVVAGVVLAVYLFFKLMEKM